MPVVFPVQDSRFFELSQKPTPVIDDQNQVAIISDSGTWINDVGILVYHDKPFPCRE